MNEQTHGRAIGAAGFIPADMSKKQRRELNKAARAVETSARQALLAERKATLDAERQARKNAAYLPPSGEPGPRQLRSPRRLRIIPHRATSDVLSVAYPFLAEAGLGSDGPLIGHDSWSGSAFVYDPWMLYNQGVITNPNVLLAGIIGRGKSTLAKSLAVRSIAFGRRIYVPGDPKGEWTPVAEAVGGAAIKLGGTNRMNPLDEGPRPAGLSDADWQEEVTSRRKDLLLSLTEMALGGRLSPIGHTALAAALTHAVQRAASRGETPVLPLVVDELLAPSSGFRNETTTDLKNAGRDAGHALGRLVFGDLAGLFDGPSTITFDPNLPMVTLDLSAISGSDTRIGLVMTCASAWMEAALRNPDGGQRWVIYDEAWRIIASPALLSRMQTQWKLSRHWGIANMMIIHRLSDLDAVGDANSETRNLAQGLLADCSTRIIYAQERGEATKTGATIGLTQTETNQLPDLERGEGLWRIGERAYIVRHTITPNELCLYDTNSRMR